ncbi:hypothetical protein BV22DRAFT_1085170 [Leucogyrophana mollusca]|uniref:Uncharacterized protein n=1 Tax=Leucogyrophana mollusca TaxID=85980 RepID=A0ACB8BND8_9AGAM|nr:hypothetical protein BV22DRAFT_1085170 [Leucogyrophana mollusca]
MSAAWSTGYKRRLSSDSLTSKPLGFEAKSVDTMQLSLTFVTLLAALTAGVCALPSQQKRDSAAGHSTGSVEYDIAERNPQAHVSTVDYRLSHGTHIDSYQ